MFAIAGMAIILVAAVNVGRFFFSDQLNRLLLAITVSLAAYAIAMNATDIWLVIILTIPIWICGICYRLYGAMFGGVLSSIVYFAMIDSIKPETIYIIMMFIAGSLAWGQYNRSVALKRQQVNKWMKQLLRQSKELNIVREISSALQATLEQEKLLHIVLTAITAGYGHGINRAMLFLISEDGNSLKGRLGIGSLSRQEGLVKWYNISKGNMSLKEYITNDNEAKSFDIDLNGLTKETSFPLDPPNILSIAMNEFRPSIINTKNQADDVEVKLLETFGIESCAIVPLVIQGEKFGVIVLDNNINQLPITREQLDSIVPIANQAAIALHNSNLYTQAQELAITDGLTGLYNQRFFQRMLNSYFNTTRRTKIPLSVIVLDIDHFKSYNDTNGHVQGNEVLIGVAHMLRDSIRKDDLSFRFGGEEFVVLLSSTIKKDAIAVAEKIRSNIEEAEFFNQAAQPNGNLTVSIGVASFPEDEDNPQSLLHAADLALYEAKRRGRNRVIGFEEGMR